MIDRALLSRDSAKEIRRVHLHARKVRPNLHPDARRRTHAASHHVNFPVAGLQHIVVIIAAAGLKRRIVCINLRPDGLRGPEIHGGSGNIGQLSGGDALFGCSIVIRVDGDDMVQDIAASLPRQIEVRVVCEIHHRIRIAGCVIIDDDLAVLGQGVGDSHIQRPRESLLHVRHDSGKCHRCPAVIFFPRRLVVELCGADAAAVEVVLPLVLLQLVDLSADGNLRTADAVGISSHRAADAAVVVHIAFHIVIAENAVHRLPVPVRDDDAYQRRAVVGHGNLHAPAVLHGI